MFDTTGTLTSTSFSYFTPQFNDFESVAFDHIGNVYVAHYDGNCVLKYNAAGNLLATWDVSHPSFNRSGVALDVNGSIYVSDGDNGRVVKLDEKGAYVTRASGR